MALILKGGFLLYHYQNDAIKDHSVCAEMAALGTKHYLINFINSEA